ncbi:MAG: hypothetical protein ABR550_03020 [Wenzhouxiangellaceae bacterium]
MNSRGNLNDDQRVNALWRVNLATGNSEYIGWTGFVDVEGLAFDADGRLFGADDDRNTLIRISPTGGFGFPVANSLSNMSIPITQTMDFGMSFTCDGRLLVSSDYRHSLYLADPETGILNLIGQDGALGVPITDIATWGGAVFGIGQGLDANWNSDSPNLYRIDAETATAELIGPLGPAVSPYANAGLAFDADGVLWAVTDRRDNGQSNLPSEILRIDTATGTAEKVADANIVGFESLAISAPAGCDTQGEPSPPSPREVPVLAPIGQSTLIMLLFVLAGWTLGVRQR